ncbi:hypothetical protein M9H77_14561 [Catharanthus roseus]|uniref:Uncharacterized protein n=1 Tax=Catharanthus roseus TaxID=4058 RepID=A0ACC0BNF8_CATRO|nr:hypothetical protein M9H77_14561 [Catharanthus roseus]
MPKKKKLARPSNTKEPVMGAQVENEGSNTNVPETSVSTSRTLGPNDTLSSAKVKLHLTNQNMICQRSHLYLCLKMLGYSIDGCKKKEQEVTGGKQKEGAQNQSADTTNVECPKESGQTVVEKGRSNKNGKGQASSSSLKQGMAVNEQHKKDIASVTQNHPPDGQDPGAAKGKEGNKVGSKEAQGDSTKDKEQGRPPTQNPTIGLAATGVNTNEEVLETIPTKEGDPPRAAVPKKSSHEHIATKRSGKDVEEEELETTPATDVNSTGTFFTWTNNQTWSKIDRAMCNQVWFSEGLYANARFLHWGFISNHSSCIVSLFEEPKIHKPSFVFFNKWCEHDLFLGLVETGHGKLLARSLANLGGSLLTIRDALVEKEGSTLQAANQVVSWVYDDTLNTSLAYDYFKRGGRLSTKDRLLFLDIDRLCNICSRQEENLSDLFFACPFTSDIWKSIKEWAGLTRDMSTISRSLKWLLKENGGTSWKCTWRKLCFAATLYYGQPGCMIGIPITV